jgi:pilus assembly protein CpaF
MGTMERPGLFALLEPLLADPDVTEIMVDSYDRVYVERHGKLEDVPSPFRDADQLAEVIRSAVVSLGFRWDESAAFGDWRLPDFSRLNVVWPPVAVGGPAVTIRKFVSRILTSEDLIGFGSWNEDIVVFLRACVQSRLNMVVAGGTGSGKMTVLNIVAGMVPDTERIVIVQDAAELKPTHRRLVTLEARPPDREGRGAVTTRDLIYQATRMRPDRIIFAEAYAGQATGGEALLELLYAMNNGYEGTMIGMHANNVRDVLDRLEMMTAQAHPSIPLLSLRHEIASAVDIVTYQALLGDGSRKMLKIAEVIGMQGDQVASQDILEFRQTGMQDGRIVGYFTATGNVPRCLDRLRQASIDLPASLFVPR